MSKKEEIITQIKSTMNELDKLIAKRKELEEQIQKEESECFGILINALQEIEEDTLTD